jgi:hypothetical protein
MRNLTAPIPGQSLTTPPKNYPWERPPEIVDPEEAIQMHITRLSDPELLDAALTTMELQDLDIATVTKGIMRGAVANGIHSIDVGLLVAPVVHEFLKQAAKAAGMTVDDGFVDKKAKDQENKGISNLRASKMLKKMGAKPKEVAKEISKVEEAPTAVAEEVEVPPARKGLMARGEV